MNIKIKIMLANQKNIETNEYMIDMDELNRRIKIMEQELEEELTEEQIRLTEIINFRSVASDDDFKEISKHMEEYINNLSIDEVLNLNLNL